MNNGLHYKLSDGRLKKDIADHLTGDIEKNSGSNRDVRHCEVKLKRVKYQFIRKVALNPSIYSAWTNKDAEEHRRHLEKGEAEQKQKAYEAVVEEAKSPPRHNSSKFFEELRGVICG